MSDPHFWMFADGSCGSGSNGVGAWTALVVGPAWRKAIYGSAHPTTISRCELLPLIEGLRHIRSRLPRGANGIRVRAYSDSEYTIRTLSGDFPQSKNEDLWAAMAAARAGFEIEWIYRQRNSHPCMQFCDMLCSMLRKRVIAQVQDIFGQGFDPLDLAAELPAWTMPELRQDAAGLTTGENHDLDPGAAQGPAGGGETADEVAE